MPTIREPRGFVPREQGCSLPPEYASVAVNLNPSARRFQPWRRPVQVVQFPFEVKSAHIRDCCWAGVPECDARYIDAGLPKRTYLSGHTRPEVTDSLCDQQWCWLGYPIPDQPVGLVDPCHAVDKGPDMESRRYRITYGTDCEEGPASCPSEAIVARKDTNVALALPAPPDEQWCATHVHIYRQQATWDTEKGLATFESIELNPGYGDVNTETDWFKIATLEISERGWLDDGTNEIGSLLVTEDYYPPSEDLELVGETSFGSLVGFEGNNVWFSERNTHYAWPLKSRHTFESEVLDACTFGSRVAVFTCQSIHLLEESEECRDASCRLGIELMDSTVAVGHRSCMRCPNGVLYISTEGLMLLDSQGSIRNISSRSYLADDWEALDPKTIRLEKGPTFLLILTRQGVVVWDYVFDQEGFLPPDVSMLSFTPDQFMRDDKGELYFIAGNAAYKFDADDEYMQMEWQQAPQRTDRPETLSNVRAEYVKKRTNQLNVLQLRAEERVLTSKPLRQGNTRVRGQRSRCFTLGIKGSVPMCSVSYGAGLTRGGEG